jgi:hypothetical protein
MLTELFIWFGLVLLKVCPLQRSDGIRKVQAAEPNWKIGFNSMPFKEVVKRGETAVPELLSSLNVADQRSWLGLLAVRKLSTSKYESLKPAFRVAVLIDALRASKHFNAWGLPHLYWGEAAKAIRAEGAVAEEQLHRMDLDRRPAPLWGSEHALEFRRYRYRACDYAWALAFECFAALRRRGVQC